MSEVEEFEIPGTTMTLSYPKGHPMISFLRTEAGKDVLRQAGVDVMAAQDEVYMKLALQCAEEMP